MVLKIRRRKFQRTPQKGEIVITRRLFRTGESEYLLNGKLCRLRDIQDIFMGTGLGPESYAIIGQERIGQLLSSKPHDRRAIIEEAAGITRFKTKKRLAELRLESAKQNLARVDDIFEEVTRQMNSLKRQAAKAERFAAVRDELRGRLRVVLASRMALMDAEQARLEQEIAALTEQIDVAAARDWHDGSSQHSLTERGYELDAKDRKRRTAPTGGSGAGAGGGTERSNTERVRNWKRGWRRLQRELEQTQTQLADDRRRARRSSGSFWRQRRAKPSVSAKSGGAATGSARGGRRGFQRRAAAGERSPARDAPADAGRATRAISTAQAKRAWRLWSAKPSGWTRRWSQARNEQESLGVQSGQARLDFESAAETLKRLEGEIAALREQLQSRRAEENAVARAANQLRSEQATAAGAARLAGVTDSQSQLLHRHGAADC